MKPVEEMACAKDVLSLTETLPIRAGLPSHLERPVNVTPPRAEKASHLMRLPYELHVQIVMLVLASERKLKNNKHTPTLQKYRGQSTIYNIRKVSRHFRNITDSIVFRDIAFQKRLKSLRDSRTLLSVLDKSPSVKEHVRTINILSSSLSQDDAEPFRRIFGPGAFKNATRVHVWKFWQGNHPHDFHELVCRAAPGLIRLQISNIGIKESASLVSLICAHNPSLRDLRLGFRSELFDGYDKLESISALLQVSFILFKPT
jgi:hypothetical protein